MISKLNDVMVDIETMGTGLYPSIVSIAAIQCNIETGEIGETFKIGVTLSSNDKYGLHCEGQTVTWWLNQSDQAKKSLLEMETVDLRVALIRFARWLNHLPGNPCIWGKGPNFDLRILSTAYKFVDYKQPWPYFKERCVRTLIDLYPKCTELAKRADYIKHDPIHDCHYQIRCCVIALDHFKKDGYVKPVEETKSFFRKLFRL